MAIHSPLGLEILPSGNVMFTIITLSENFVLWPLPRNRLFGMRSTSERYLLTAMRLGAVYFRGW